jgi:hypothetical protein
VAPAVALVAVVAHLLQASTLTTFLAGILGQWTVPIGVVTIICGHLALRQAKRYPPAQARRTVALIGLVLGYGTLVAFLGFIAYILTTFH